MRLIKPAFSNEERKELLIKTQKQQTQNREIKTGGRKRRKETKGMHQNVSTGTLKSAIQKIAHTTISALIAGKHTK